MKKILLYFLAWKLTIFSFAYLATFILPLIKTYTVYGRFGLNVNYYLWIWGNFDGAHYLDIAIRGYQSFEYPFFPFLPLLIRGTSYLFKFVGDDFSFLVSGVLISNAALILSLLIGAKLLTLDKKKSLIPLAYLIIFFFPTSFFYGAVYNDSLFLLLATSAIFFSRKRNFVVASFLGAAATLTRLNGLALVFLILLEYLAPFEERDGWKIDKLMGKFREKLRVKRILESKIFFILLIPASFVSYLIYVQILSGNWYSLFSVMDIWRQSEPIFPLQVVWRYFKIFLLAPKDTIVYWVAVFEFVSVLFYVAMLIFSFKKIRLSYWVFFAMSLLIPSLTGTFAGMPRYGLHIYPLFLSIALFLKNKSLKFKLTYFAISLALFLFAITLFTRGYFVS